MSDIANINEIPQLETSQSELSANASTDGHHLLPHSPSLATPHSPDVSSPSNAYPEDETSFLDQVFSWDHVPMYFIDPCNESIRSSSNHALSQYGSCSEESESVGELMSKTSQSKSPIHAHVCC